MPPMTTHRDKTVIDSGDQRMLDGTERMKRVVDGGSSRTRKTPVRRARGSRSLVVSVVGFRPQIGVQDKLSVKEGRVSVAQHPVVRASNHIGPRPRATPQAVARRLPRSA